MTDIEQRKDDALKDCIYGEDKKSPTSGAEFFGHMMWLHRELIRELLQPSPPVADSEVDEAINWIKKHYLSEPHGDHNPFPAYLKTLIRNRHQPPQEWRTMESAPRDGTHLQFWMNGEAWFGKWYENASYPKLSRWKIFGAREWADQPTHWMMIPSPPKETRLIKQLTKEEKEDLLKHAENLWHSLQKKNDLGGYSGINRPFWIVSVFREIIEEFGNRDTGYTWSQDDLEKARAAGVLK